MDKPIKIVINELGGAQWTGGITYRNNLLKAIKTKGPTDQIVCLSSNPENSGLDRSFKIIKIQTRFNAIEKILSRVLKSFFDFDYSLYKTTKSEKPDVLFPHSLCIGNNASLIFWIPDFQFVHLPHLYPSGYVEMNRKKLDGYFKKAKIIVVSSEDALKDLKLFLPQHVSKTRVMRFVAHVPERLYLDDPKEAIDTYNLPSDFIFLPNQFWSHKNHLAVFEALKLLQEENIFPYIVCTGNPVDVRNPGYLAGMLQKISELGVRNQVAFLGLLPHDHVYSLIRQSKCVLNPSLFEGWSTSVEEAKSVGKRMVLSDLDVHKEQAPAKSLYFERSSTEDLARQLKKAWLEFESGPDLELEKEARSILNDRMKGFANRFFDICEEANKIK
jgi:glycosyltransferase involved in cell wall biosynthesis